MTKFDRGTQKVHEKLSKLSLGYIKGIPFLYFQSKGTEKVHNIVPFLYLISVWEDSGAHLVEDCGAHLGRIMEHI